MLYRFMGAGVVCSSGGKHDWHSQAVCVADGINKAQPIPKIRMWDTVIDRLEQRIGGPL